MSCLTWEFIIVTPTTEMLRDDHIAAIIFNFLLMQICEFILGCLFRSLLLNKMLWCIFNISQLHTPIVYLGQSVSLTLKQVIEINVTYHHKICRPGLNKKNENLNQGLILKAGQVKV
jgi:hypothetical protein